MATYENWPGEFKFLWIQCKGNMRNARRLYRKKFKRDFHADDYIRQKDTRPIYTDVRSGTETVYQ